MKTICTSRSLNPLSQKGFLHCRVGGGIGVGVGIGIESPRQKILAPTREKESALARAESEPTNQPNGETSRNLSLKRQNRAGRHARPFHVTKHTTLQHKAEQLFAFGDFLLERYHVKCLTDLPAGPRADYRTQAKRLDLPAYGLPLYDRNEVRA